MSSTVIVEFSAWLSMFMLRGKVELVGFILILSNIAQVSKFSKLHPKLIVLKDFGFEQHFKKN